MRITHFISAILILASYSATSCEYPVASTKLDDGRYVGLVIPEKVISSQEKWNPTESEPPISIVMASQKIKEWAKEKYSKYDNVNIAEISLADFRRRNQGYWYYKFDLVPMFDGRKVFHQASWAVLLFDGTIIEPTEIEKDCQF